MNLEMLAKSLELISSAVQGAPIIGQSIVATGGSGGGPVTGLRIDMMGGSGRGSISIGQNVTAIGGQNNALAAELKEAATIIRSGNAPKSILKSLMERAVSALGGAIASSGTKEAIDMIKSYTDG